LKIMRSFVSLAASLAVALALLAACSPRDTSAPASNASAQGASAERASTKPATATEPPAAEDVRRVTREELQAGLEKGAVALFDVRDKVSYEAGHIKGAKLVPWGEVETRLDEFPKDKLIVTYCA
jgi:3-mercaptopyruvate sulfurtransferase SseA